VCYTTDSVPRGASSAHPIRDADWETPARWGLARLGHLKRFRSSQRTARQAVDKGLPQVGAKPGADDCPSHLHLGSCPAGRPVRVGAPGLPNGLGVAGSSSVVGRNGRSREET
jgi:hypothetical protein